MNSQLALFDSIPSQQVFAMNSELVRSFKWNVSAYHCHRQGNAYQRHISYFEREKAADQLHQLGGLSAIW